MNTVLGISAFFHDSAAALVRDGHIVAAAQEERFSRVKHDPRFPGHAIEYCLQAAGLAPGALDAVVFYEKPFLKFERLLETWLAFAPCGWRSFRAAIPSWLRQKLFLPREIDRGLSNAYRGPIHFVRHHQAHAASAFFPSPFEEAALLTMDGVGEWTTTSWGVGRGNRVQLRQDIRFPHSLGLLYSAFTGYLGFRVNSGEHKVMGLAPYGEPRYANRILERILDLNEDGSFRLDQSYFRYGTGLTMTSETFHALFGGPPRAPEAELTQREMDLAASIQAVTEEVVLRMARHVHRQTKLEYLCLAGGVALNAVANGRLRREGPFRDLWIQPAAGDAGGALGAALFGWYQVGDRPRSPAPGDSQEGSLLGPSFDSAAVRAALESLGARYTRCDGEAALCRRVADLLAAGKIVGVLAGRMEFGPRALGNRSILADPRVPGMQEAINRRVKFRESFRPFAPSCLAERTAEYFEIDHPSPYMLFTVNVRRERQRTLTADERQRTGLAKLGVVRSDLPAVTHVDGSARLQTVDPARNARFYGILKAFEARTGCGVLLNTSFNVRGEPIVCRPEEAYRCFLATGMDALVLEDCVCLKEEQQKESENRRTGTAW